MKVKCRGYEGEVAEMYSVYDITRLGGILGVYDLKILVKLGEVIELSNVRDDEIEFIKGDEK